LCTSCSTPWIPSATISAARFGRAVDESRRHLAIVHFALDICRVDETVRSQPIVQLLADAIVDRLAAGRKWSEIRHFSLDPLAP
jgi:hypothetical protein